MRYRCGYGWHMHMNNLIAYCKKLHKEGYTNKQIALVTKLSASNISRVVNNQTYAHINAQDFWRDSVFENRLQVLNTLLECHEIAGSMGLDENNKIYIKILKRVGANFDKVKVLYYDISKKALRNAWAYPVGNISDFDSKQLNITAVEIMDLLKEKEDIE
jgi:hypothetical protein